MSVIIDQIWAALQNALNGLAAMVFQPLDASGIIVSHGGIGAAMNDRDGEVTAEEMGYTAKVPAQTKLRNSSKKCPIL